MLIIRYVAIEASLTTQTLVVEFHCYELKVDFVVRSSEFEWNFSQDLSAILVKQEEPDGGRRSDTLYQEDPPLISSPAPSCRGPPWRHTVSIHKLTALLLIFKTDFLQPDYCVFAGVQPRGHKANHHQKRTGGDGAVPESARW